MKTMKYLSLAMAVALVSACGSDDPSTDPDGGADTPDAKPGTSVCGFEDRFLPYQPGYKWTYRVTDLTTPGSTNKSQTLTMETDPELGEVIVQTTNKGTGSTVSALKRIDEAVVRLRQLDLDGTGTLERTTTYDPGQNRLDEASAHLVLGAEWDDDYSLTVEKVGDAPVVGSRTDHWKVLGVDVDCESPLGSFKCLHVQRVRTAGGISDKQFFFAKGIGKIKEVNASQIEELVSCEVL